MKNRCVLFQTIRRGLSEGQLETKLAEAEIRRKELQEEKVKQVMEHSGLERHGRMRSASAYKYVIPNFPIRLFICVNGTKNLISIPPILTPKFTLT